ncbi:hypothetical protein C8R43DRAFT_1147222 [Mycena crocata]|nr:hypothetical protein C8R43DRAFT_1147222 [Mycena crocata]
MGDRQRSAYPKTSLPFGTFNHGSALTSINKTPEPGTLRLGNMAQTYFNSALQCLAHDPELAEYFLSALGHARCDVPLPAQTHDSRRSCSGSLRSSAGTRSTTSFVDRSVQADLVNRNGYKYFANILDAQDEPPLPNSSEHNAKCSFILAAASRDSPHSQDMCVPHIWDGHDQNKVLGVNSGTQDKLITLLSDFKMEVAVVTGATLIIWDAASSMRRKEIVVLLSYLVKEYRGFFVSCAWVKEPHLVPRRPPDQLPIVLQAVHLVLTTPPSLRSSYDAPHQPPADAMAYNVIEALVEEHMERPRTRRRSGTRRGHHHGGSAPSASSTVSPMDANNSIILRLGMGVGMADVLPLKITFFDWCSEYFTKPQMRQAEADEPGSIQFNYQMWRQNRNNNALDETGRQSEIAERRRWDRPVTTLHVPGHPLTTAFHAFNKHVFLGNESNVASALLMSPNLWSTSLLSSFRRSSTRTTRWAYTVRCPAGSADTRLQDALNSEY